MKALITSIIIFAILSFQFSELIVIVSFKINQDFIAKNLCVEKDVEGSACKGCCQLKKKLNEQQEQKDELPPNQENKQNYDFIVNDIINTPVNVNNFSNRRFEYIENYRFSNSLAVFHPPKMIV